MNSEKQVRYSKQREKIYDYLCSSMNHPCAERIYEDLKKEMPNLSLGTVYRNLKFLQDTGKITALKSTDGIEHYDAFCSNHAHYICQECGEIFDIKEIDYSTLTKSLNLDECFSPQKIILTVVGQCPKCKKN